MRLIDADALLESAGIFEAKACARGCGKSILSLAKTWLFNEVYKAPTIDAVPVVRCRDCVHFGAEACAFDAWTPYCVKHKLSVFPDDFCSYGERKDGDGNG